MMIVIYFLLFLILLILLLLGGFVWHLQKIQINNNDSRIRELVEQVFGASVQKITQQSKQVLEADKELIKNDLDNKQRSFEKMLEKIVADLREQQKEIKLLENDRITKFAELAKALEEHNKINLDLRQTTAQLSSLLSNNQARGEWGERIIEDLLVANGLVEGVHYLKQVKQIDTGLKPDIILLLPEKRVVPIDVKFPYQALQKMAQTEKKEEKAVYLKQFQNDVKSKVAKVAQYISAVDGTVDYAILFVPNEMIFSFINQKLPQVIDEALAKKVLVVSPFTFLIVARTVMESYRNFMVGDKLREVVGSLDQFASEWEVFKQEFFKFDRQIDSLRKVYDSLTTTRFKKMDKRIEQLQAHRQAGKFSTDRKVSGDLELIQLK